MPSQGRNHYSQEKQEAHLESAHAFKKTAYLHCPSNVSIPTICLSTLYCRWQMSLVSVMEHHDDTNWEIGDYETADSRECTLSPKIDEDDWDHQQEVLLQSQEGQDKSLRTTRVPLPKKQSHANTVIPRPQLPNSRNPARVMRPPLLKCRKSTLLKEILLVWLFASCSGTAAIQIQWRPNCSTTKGQCWSEYSPTPKGYILGSETVHGGNCIHEDSLANIIQWQVLDGWKSLETSHWSSGSSAGISRCSCRCTICVSIAWRFISQNRSANMTSCNCWMLFNAPLSDLQYWQCPTIYRVKTEDHPRWRMVGRCGTSKCCL